VDGTQRVYIQGNLNGNALLTIYLLQNNSNSFSLTFAANISIDTYFGSGNYISMSFYTWAASNLTRFYYLDGSGRVGTIDWSWNSNSVVAFTIWEISDNTELFPNTEFQPQSPWVSMAVVGTPNATWANVIIVPKYGMIYNLEWSPTGFTHINAMYYPVLNWNFESSISLSSSRFFVPVYAGNGNNNSNWAVVSYNLETSGVGPYYSFGFWNTTVTQVFNIENLENNEMWVINNNNVTVANINSTVWVNCTGAESVWSTYINIEAWGLNETTAFAQIPLAGLYPHGNNEENGENSSSGSSAWVWILLIVLLGGAAGIYFFIKRRGAGGKLGDSIEYQTMA